MVNDQEWEGSLHWLCCLGLVLPFAAAAEAHAGYGQSGQGCYCDSFLPAMLPKLYMRRAIIISPALKPGHDRVSRWLRCCQSAGFGAGE